MMHPYVFLAVGLWFLFGLVTVLFLGPAIVEWIRKFNLKYGERFAHHFKSEGKRRNPAEVARALLWIELGALILATVLFRNAFFSFWAFVMTFGATWYFDKLLHQKELERFDDQMVDITYAMKNSLKAGMTLQQSMQLIATEFRDPASEQFKIGLREIQIGANVEEALAHIEERMPNADMKIIVNAVEILRQTGGNMIDTFEQVTETLKNRKRVEGKIKTLTAQGRMQALILCAMPFVMMLMLYFMNREYVEPLFTTGLGIVMLTVICLLVATGWVIINKIITIEV